MAEERSVDPEEDNSTTQAPEEKEEQPSPSEEDNEEQEQQAPISPEEFAELKAKVEDQARKLKGSRDEALRLKEENERLKSKPKDEPQYPTNESELKIFEAYAQKAGYVKADEIKDLKERLYKDKVEGAKDKFFKEHPEYNKPGDPNSDKLWDAILGEVKKPIYNTNPDDPAAWYDLLKTAHKNISQETDSFRKGEALGMAKANLKQPSGSGSGGTSTPKKKKTPEQQQVSEGFKKVRPQYYS